MGYANWRSDLSKAHQPAHLPDYAGTRLLYPDGDIEETESSIDADPRFVIRIPAPLDIQPIIKRQIFTIIDVHGDGVLLNTQVLDDVDALEKLLAKTVRNALDPLLKCEELFMKIPDDKDRKKTIKDNLVVDFDKAHKGVRVNLSGKISYIMNGSLELEPLQAFALLRQDISAYISQFLTDGILDKAEQLYFMAQMSPDSSPYEDLIYYLEGELVPFSIWLGRVIE